MNSLVASVADIVTESAPTPPRICVYGVPGIGKTTFAAHSYAPVFIECEQSLDKIQGELAAEGIKPGRWPEKPANLDDFKQMVDALGREEHPFGTLVVDTLESLERLIWADVCAAKHVRNIDEIDFGKGYTEAITHWTELLALLDHLRLAKGMAIILISHARTLTFKSPLSEGYDRYTLSIHDGSEKIGSARRVVTGWCDHVLFANWRVTLTEDKRTKVKRGVGSGERVMYTEERPGFLAKHRGTMPDEMPFDFNTFATYLNGAQA